MFVKDDTYDIDSGFRYIAIAFLNPRIKYAVDCRFPFKATF